MNSKGAALGPQLTTWEKGGQEVFLLLTADKGLGDLMGPGGLLVPTGNSIADVQSGLKRGTPELAKLLSLLISQPVCPLAEAS